MIEELRARFRTRFIDTARQRVRSSLALLGSKDGADQLVTELHSLAGEAAMLGLQDISDTARAGEKQAKQWLDGTATAQLQCVRTVRKLSQCVEAFAAEPAEPPADEPKPGAPQAAAAPGASPAAAAPDASRAAASASARRVLVIDDSELAGEHVADALSNAGLPTRLATDQAQALAEVASFAPGLAVCDVNMPGVDLGELCRALRDKSAQPIAILLLSGMSDEELAERARDVAADGYIPKGRGIEYVVERVVGHFAEPQG